MGDLKSRFPARLTAVALVCLCLGRAFGQAFVVADGDKPACEIVVQHPSPAAAFAARELQRYAEAMSGARLEITEANESGGPAITLAQADLGHGEAFRIALQAPGRLIISVTRSRVGAVTTRVRRARWLGRSSRKST